MKYDEDNETYTLSTGKEFYACCGYLGLGPPGRPAAVHGYDGGIRDDFTQEERVEVALAMMARWVQWAKHVEEGETL